MRLSKSKMRLVITSKSLYTLFALFPVLFYMANLYRMMGNSSFFYRLTIYMFGAIGIVMFVISRKPNTAFSIVAIVYFISGILNIITVGNLTLNDVIADIFFFGIAYIMLVCPCTYFQGTISFYIMYLTFLSMYLRGANTHSLLTSSGNYISVLLIIAVSLYYISLEQSERQMMIWDVAPAFLCFFLAVWAKGRGGILSTGLLVVLMMIQLMLQIQSKNRKRILVFFILLFSIGVVMLLPDFSITKWFFSLGKWAYRGTDNSARAQIWSSYLEKMSENLIYILFGAPLDQISVISRLGGNCHNSFLQLHAYNGLLMIMVFLLYLVRSLVFYIKSKNWICISMLLVFCIRALTDKFIFGQYGMPLMLYFILRPYYQVKPISDAEIKQLKRNVKHKKASQTAANRYRIPLALDENHFR